MKRIITASLLVITLSSSVALADPMGMKDEMMKCDTNKDGMISKDEFIKSKTEMFMKMDKNSDGMLDASEQKEMMEHMHAKMKDDGTMKKDM